MQNSIYSSTNDEIDITELFSTLWSHKIFITIICILSILVSAKYASTLNEKYTATSIFKLDSSSEGGMQIPSEMGALAAIAGIGDIASPQAPIDKIMGRKFIINLDKEMRFRDDTFFNNFNPNYVEPSWKAFIKKFIGTQHKVLDSEEALWQTIVKKYSDNVLVENTKNGSIEITVTHTSADRAAEIANAIMLAIINQKENKKNKQQDEQLEYLAQTLANSLSDLEFAQMQIKNFSLEKNILPLENFSTNTLKLAALREQLTRTIELHRALAELASLIKSGATNNEDYILLRETYPIVDQVEFRRVLGQNEIISSWNWPDLPSVTTVFNTLTERKKRLEADVLSAQSDADKSGLELEDYAQLERQAKVAEATYTVLIEQVKAQSMMAGYRPNNSEIFGLASPPLKPSSPKRTLIIAISALFGLIISCILVLIFAARQGIYYSKRALIANVSTHLNVNVRPFLPLRKHSLEKTCNRLNRQHHLILRDLAVEIHKNEANIVAFTSSQSKLKGVDLAKALACYMQSDSMKIAIINFSEITNTKILKNNLDLINSFIIIKKLNYITLLQPNNDLESIELLGQKDFRKQLKSLHADFNMILLCADNSDAISLTSALSGLDLIHISIARIRHTNSFSLNKLNTALPIQGIYYE